MKKNIFAISLLAIAAITGSMCCAQVVEASTEMKSMEKVPVTHHGTGSVRKIDAEMVTLSHGPIASLNWPAMTMSFKLKDAALARGIKVGDVVDFELVQSGGNYVVTRISIK